MRRRPLGQTGLEVTELALGTWGFSGDGYGPAIEGEAEKVIDRARAIGINLFETADNYASGTIEKKLGERLENDAEAIIVTKLGTDLDASPPRKRFDAAYLRRAFEASRERLRRQTVDVVLLHNPSTAALGVDETTGVLRELKTEGAIKAWGVSCGSREVLEAALDAKPDVVSLPYNVFQVQPLRELADRLRKDKVGVLAHSVLAYGLLCGLWPPHKEFRYGDHRTQRWTPPQLRRRIRQLDAVRPLVSGEVRSLRGAAVRFVLSEELVSSAILGPRHGTQLDQLVREAGQEPPYLSSGKLTALEQRLEQVGVTR